MKHYTKNTVSVTRWCGRCCANTPHRVDGGRMGPCLNCIEKAARLKAENQARAQRPEPAKQEALFS